MKIAVLGATGHLGRNISFALDGRDHKVTALSRPGSEWKLVDFEGEILIEENPVDAIADISHQFDWIVDAAAPFPLDLFVETSFYKDAEARTGKIVKAAITGDTGLCYISSFVTLPNQNSNAYQRFKRRSSPYYVVKKKIEDQLLSARSRGLKLVVLNPTACLGPGDFKPDSMSVIGSLLKGKIPIAMDTTVNIIDVRDMAHIVCGAIESDEPLGPTLVAGHDIHVSDLIYQVTELTGADKPTLIRSPGGITGLCMTTLESASTILNLSSPAPALLTLLMTEKAIDHEPLKHSTSLRKTIRDSINWHLAKT